MEKSVRRASFKFANYFNFSFVKKFYQTKCINFFRADELHALVSFFSDLFSVSRKYVATQS